MARDILVVGDRRGLADGIAGLWLSCGFVVGRKRRHVLLKSLAVLAAADAASNKRSPRSVMVDASCMAISGWRPLCPHPLLFNLLHYTPTFFNTSGR